MSRRHTGLRWERTSDAIRNFVRNHGQPSPRRAVLCTFDFDPDRFNASLFPHLTSRGRQFRTLIVADAGALQAKLRCLTSPTFGRYAVVPAKCRSGGVFHPKVILLRAGNHFLVGIGSANLTPGGLGGNLELMLFADHTADEGRLLARGVASFLSRLVKCKAVIMPVACRTFVHTLLAGMDQGPGDVLDTLDEALLPQMAKARRAACGKRTDSLTIVSPWHSGVASPDQTDPRVVGALRSRLGVVGPVRVFTQGTGGSGPNLGNNVEVFIPNRGPDSARTSNGGASDEDEAQVFDRRPSNLHAKAYLCCGDRGTVLFFGSANCTVPALVQPVSRGGNVEVLVATRLSGGEAQAFDNDLREMFTPAETKKDCQRPAQPDAPRGSILVGNIVGQAGRSVLRIEAPEISRGAVLIAAKRDAAKSVRVALSAGTGTVAEEHELEELFPGGVPGRTGESWSGVLWERQARLWVPFPVVVPLLEPVSGQPDAAIVEILEEEFGWWPPADNGQDGEETGDDTPGEEEEEYEDEDRETWTEAEHQGELDRIGVAVAMLRKRSASQFRSPKVARQYTALLLKRIEALPLKPHLAQEVRRFLRRLPATGRKIR